MRSTGRRRFMAAGGGLLLASPAALAQAQGRLPVLGVLSPLPPPAPTDSIGIAIAKRLEELGWIEGKTLAVERASAAGSSERLSELAAELVRKKVDAIWAFTPAAAVAAARATKSIPVVFTRVAFPLELGLGASFARPGGNVTGVASTAVVEVYLKRLEFLREIVPGIERVASLIPGTVGFTTVSGEPMKLDLEGVTRAVGKLGIDLVGHVVDRVEDFDSVLGAIAASGAQAIVASSSPLILRETRRIVEFANQIRLPTGFIESSFVEAGGLLSYGSDPLATILQSVTLVDKVLRGAKPADLPIELPTRYDLVINQRTARTLRLAIPRAILQRADRVIE